MKKSILVLILALAMLLSACAGKTDNGKDTTQDTTTAADTTNANNGGDKDPEPASVTLNVGSYNVKHFADVNHDFSIIAEDIKSKDLHIVGLQEVDNGTSRSGGVNETKGIAFALGWKYYKFARAINYQGGAYGHSIISQYPIESFETINLPMKSGLENRVFSHAVINVDGVKINFINTHLSYEETAIRIEQFKAISEYVNKLDNFIITGDFNTDDFTEYVHIKNGTAVNNADLSVKTFPSDSLTKSIDNIVVSPMFTLGRPRALLNKHSDHVMLYTTVTYTLPQAKDSD